ncbi:ATP-binding protein [Alicyclobacillus tolerans]|uniref:histidine kinase n=1 Tax=Alicyclobacillus tolerans TaxID=90970 RepID=A0A1M6N1V1_9BACL|nr:ATP-binding protein [Alicyclobacillus montanus]SHJ89671.1 PAS domain S-box-containing protein [Alicyclobacillus montanus]
MKWRTRFWAGLFLTGVLYTFTFLQTNHNHLLILLFLFVLAQVFILFPVKIGRLIIFPGTLVANLLIFRSAPLWLSLALLVGTLLSSNWIVSRELSIRINFAQSVRRYFSFALGYLITDGFMNLAEGWPPLALAVSSVFLFEFIQWLIDTRQVVIRNPKKFFYGGWRYVLLRQSYWLWPLLAAVIGLWRSLIVVTTNDTNIRNDLFWIAIPYISFSMLIYHFNELREKQQELHFHYRLVAENINRYIVFVDKSQIIRYCSGNLIENCGDFCGQSLEAVAWKFLSEDNMSKIVKGYQKALETEKSQQFTFHEHRANHFIAFDLDISPAMNEQERLLGVVLVVNNVTEREQWREKVAKADRLAVVSQMAAGVAHEIRNPVTSIKGFLQLSRDLYKDHPKYWQMMYSELTNIEQVINDYLQLAHSLSASTAIYFNLREWLNIWMEEVRSKAQQQSVYVDERVIEEDVWILGHPHALGRAFACIWQNALEAMGQGGRLTILLEIRENKVVWQIIDTGVGMSIERVRHLGEPFYGTSERGIGIGLMIANKLVSEHQGELVIESKPGHGTQVTIRLPRYTYPLPKPQDSNGINS